MNSVLESVKRATVKVSTAERGDGQGVLVPGGFILTAAHCVDWDHTGSMALGDYYLQTITSADGKRFRVSPYAVEPCRDIAALGGAEDHYRDSVAFDEFCEATRPVEVMLDSLPQEKLQDAFVLSHRGNWIRSQVIQ